MVSKRVASLRICLIHLDSKLSRLKNKAFILFIIVFADIVIGCSRIELGLKIADRYLVSQIDSFFDLTSLQKNQAQNSAKEFISGVRAQVFPELAGILRYTLMDIQSNKLTTSRISDHQVSFRNLLQKLSWMSWPYVEPLLKSLNSDQIEYFKKEALEKADKERSKIIDGSKKEEFIDGWLDQFENLTGSISKKQKELINSAFKAHSPPWLEQLDFRVKNINRFSELKNDKSQLLKFTEQLFKEPLQSRPQELQSLIEANDIVIRTLLLDLWLTMDSKQKNTLIENLQQYVNDFEKLTQVAK
jgi:hypothetical protein